MALVATDQLAINGGPKAVTNKLKMWPQFDEPAIKAVEEVLRSGKVNYWTGNEGRQFEKEYAAYTGTQHAIAVANGTVGLELALCRLERGASYWISPLNSQL